MRIEVGFQPSCSEAVFRFHTVDPKNVRIILQALADEVQAHYPDDEKWRKESTKTVSKQIDVSKYEDVNIRNCAGLGDNDTVISVDKKKGYFTVNIGNNDISDDKTGWKDVIKGLKIKIQEAEYSKELTDLARDCTCGITYFDGYKGLIKDRKEKKEEK